MAKEGKLFETVEFETEDVSRTLNDFAKKYNLDPKSIDFKINSVETVAFNDADKSLAIFNTMRGEPIARELFLDEKIKIYQKLSISIKELEEQPVKLDISLSADKLFTKIIATLKKESKIVYYPNLDRFIYDEINKRLVKHKILIGVFEDGFRKQIDVFVKNIRDGGKLEEDYKFTAAETTDFIPSEDDKITFYFEEKRKIDEERPDFYNRGYIVDVSEGEILAEYRKPKMGRSGRDVRGQFIKVKEPRNNNFPEFKVTQNIRVEDTPSIIRYIAAKPGYVVFDGETMDVQEELVVQEISFRNTGSIVVDQEKDITLDITESNPIVDAIGSNMTAKAHEVIVRGSMGDNSVIYADKAEVHGLTHATSKIFAKNASIATHRGYLEAKDVKIDRLEGGEIVADIVHIGHANSGKIRAKKIYITNLGSNCHITASSLIDISVILGSDNKFIFEAGATPWELEMFQKAVKKEAELTKNYNKKHDEFKKMIKLIEDNKASALKIKQQIDEDTKKGFVPREAFVLKYAQFTKMIENAKLLKSEYDMLKSEVDNIRHEVATFEDKLLDARLVNHGIWRNFQTVIFKAHGGKKECKYIPVEGSKVKEIGLFKIGDMEYSAGEIR